MDKQAFLAQLRQGLSGLPEDDIPERLTFYSEMIDDRMEEGLSQEEAVAAVGSVEEIVAQIIADTPLPKIPKERIAPKKHFKAWEIILLALGSPVWLSLLIAAIAVIASLYISLWSVILSLWAVFGSLVGCSFGSIIAGIGFALGNHTLSGIAMIGAGMVYAGLSVFMFLGCKAATKGIFLLTKKLAVWTKNRFIKKEEV